MGVQYLHQYLTISEIKVFYKGSCWELEQFSLQSNCSVNGSLHYSSVLLHSVTSNMAD